MTVADSRYSQAVGIIGTTVITDDSIVMTPSTGDTVTIAAATNGVLNITTADAGGTAGNIQITADGTVDIDSAGILTLDSGAAINIEPASGSAILLDGSISVDGNSIAFAGQGVIQTIDNDSTALAIKDASGNQWATLDTRTSGTGGTAFIFNTKNYTALTAGASNRQRAMSVGDHTVDMAGTTTVTSAWQNVSLGRITITESGGAVAINELNSLWLGNPLAGDSNVTIAKASIISLGENGHTGNVTDSRAITIPLMNEGTTKNYGIFFDGAAANGNIYSGANLNIYTVAGSNILMGDSATLLSINGDDTIDMLPSGGTIGIGTAATGHYGVMISGALTSGGADRLAAAFAIGTALTGHPGDDYWLTLCQIDGSIITQTDTGGVGIDHVSSLMVDDPTINDDDLVGDITVAATIYIRGAPDEGLTNAAIAMAAGDIKFLGSIDSASVADQVAIGGYEVDPGDRVLAISSEADVAGETDETKFSHKLKVRINGATYYMMLTAS